jgi:cytochrome c5
VSQQDSAFFRTLIIVLGALFVFFIIIIIAALYVAGDDDTASNDPRIQAKVMAQIEPVGQVNTEAGATMASAAPAGGAVDGAGTYQSACFACHGTGAAGAPKVGDKAAWADRIKQGNDTLYEHAIKGFQGKAGFMPAKGGNAGLSDAAVKAAVDHMVSNSQ